MSSAKILIVEDDSDINGLLCKILQKEGYETVSAYSGSESLLRISMETFHMILLDLMIPGTTGEEVIKQLRELGNDIPIMVISAKVTLEDKVQTLNLGADDYLTKPFENEEVVARVNARLRRSYKKENFEKFKEDKIKFKELVLDKEARICMVKEEEISLTAIEFDILTLLLEHPNKVYSKENIYQAVWKGSYMGEDSTISVHISNIRKKIGKLDESEYIKTVWSIGFKLAS
ncbi:MAG: response regulator transcription factor [Lachnospiraceae bacterium]